MGVENDPNFWEWLKERQSEVDREKIPSKHLVLELPTTPKKPLPRHEDNSEPNSPPSSSPFSEYDVDIGGVTDDSIVFQF